jgi:hypothetical protein
MASFTYRIEIGSCVFFDDDADVEDDDDLPW